MPWPDLEAACTAALKVVSEAQIAALAAAGLSIVLTAELPVLPPSTHVLEDVTLAMPEDWTTPYPLTVMVGAWPHGVVLPLHAHPDAVPALREARELQRVMGHRVNVIVDDAETLVYHAAAVEP